MEEKSHYLSKIIILLILIGETFIGYEEFEVGQNTGDCEITIYGCTDNDAINYNEYATIDNGTCVMSLEFYVSGDKNPREYIFYKPEILLKHPLFLYLMDTLGLLMVL